jgi:hypothetical protein
MHELIVVSKFICLVLGIALGFVNVAKLIYRQNISSSNNYWMAASIAGFITLQWLL